MKFQLLQIVLQQLDREETIRQLPAAETKWTLNLQTLRLNGLNSIPTLQKEINYTTIFILQSTNIDATTGKSCPKLNNGSIY